MELQDQQFLLKKLKRLKTLCEREIPGVYETWASDAINSTVETLEDDIKQQLDDLREYHNEDD